ncbi:MAG: hypothetical protein AAF192_09820 [Pseudomonadota bacterium]
MRIPLAGLALVASGLASAAAGPLFDGPLPALLPPAAAAASPSEPLRIEFLMPAPPRGGGAAAVHAFGLDPAQPLGLDPAAGARTEARVGAWRLAASLRRRPTLGGPFRLGDLSAFDPLAAAFARPSR